MVPYCGSAVGEKFSGVESQEDEGQKKHLSDLCGMKFPPDVLHENIKKSG